VKSNTRVHSLLRWYPEEWRQRYGDELIAMIEDTIGDGRPTLKFRWNIARAGMRERGQASGLLGAQRNLQHQIRAGALLVLCSWSVFIVAGALFVKQSEHFARSVPLSSRSIATSLYDVIAVMGVVGSLAVLVGASAVLPSLRSFFRNGGWRLVRRHVTMASLICLATIATLIGLTRWAHELSVGQRNGGDALYSLAFSVLALLVIAAIIECTVVGVVAVRRMTLSGRVLRFEARLAYGVTLAMVVCTIGVALWWTVVGLAAPWFFQNASVGSSGVALTPNLVVIMVLMLSSSLSGLFGSARILHGWRRI
jgi:hypothetical protein